MKYDVAVIGAGPGGYVAAIRLGQLGLKVACIDKGGVGGTCLNVGCIPSKTLLHWTHAYSQFMKHGKTYGFDASGMKVDWTELQKGKASTIAGLDQGIRGLFKKNKVTYIEAAATFVSPKMLSLSGKTRETLEADRFILATGSVPAALPFLPFDEKKVLSSTGALSLGFIPESMSVIGGGAIGLELASVYQRLGTKIAVIDILENLLPTLDSSLSRQLQQNLEQQGFKFHLDTKITNGKVSDKGVSLMLEKAGGKSVIDSEVCLVAVGRKPYTEGLGLQEIGVKLNDKGFVQVDDCLRTAQDHIYAIGDLIEGPMLAHKASEEGVAVAELIAGKAPTINYLLIPNVVYTSPEAASVGFTEQEARAAGLDVMLGTFPFRANSRARCTAEEAGFVKVIGERSSGRLIGMHILGPHAGDLIHEGVIALQAKARVSDIAHACHAHPTYSEAIKEAALAAIDQPIHF